MSIDFLIKILLSIPGGHAFTLSLLTAPQYVLT
jgi:hypothetical protein